MTDTILAQSKPVKKDASASFQIVDKLDENINWAIPNWYFHFLFA